MESYKCLIKTMNDRESVEDKNGDKEQRQQIQNSNKYGACKLQGVQQDWGLGCETEGSFGDFKEPGAHQLVPCAQPSW